MGSVREKGSHFHAEVLLTVFGQGECLSGKGHLVIAFGKEIR